LLKAFIPSTKKLHLHLKSKNTFRMNYKRCFSSFLVCLLSISSLIAQNSYDQANFRSPLDIPLVLAGTFGELRSNHFHSGIDIKTKGREGFPVFAIEDGYVSRMKTSAAGYGKALYITHKNGFVSVYAHLQNYNDSLAKRFLEEQYNKQKFELDFFPEINQFKVSKGDTIAFTGNSGSSTAPHLHFEIRDALSQEIINPLLFGFKAKDTTPPFIKNIHIYPLDEESSINNSADTLRIPVRQISERKYQIDSTDIRLKGLIGFGVEVFDRLDNAPNKNGVYSIELYIDSSLIYKHRMERFAFTETRYINSLMDFHAKNNYSMRPQKSFVDPNNKLGVYEHLINKGKLFFNDKTEYNGLYIIKDTEGNKSTLEFTFTSDSLLKCPEKKVAIHPFYCKEENSFKNKDVEVYVSNKSLYHDIDFQYQKKQADDSFISDIHCIHNKGTAIHQSYTLSIVIDSIENRLQDKALICSLDDRGGIHCLASKWDDGKLTAKARIFGNFSAIIDTVAPNLKVKQFSRDLSNSKLMSFEVSDTLSGLSSCNAYVDGEWILLEYDAKKGRLIHYFDGKIKPGQHQLEIIVQDSVKNEKRLKLEFVR